MYLYVFSRTLYLPVTRVQVIYICRMCAGAPDRLVQWSSLRDFDMADPRLRRRFLGVVAPVTSVNKFQVRTARHDCLSAVCLTTPLLILLQGHSGPLFCCAFDRNRVFTAGGEGAIYLWDMRSGNFVAELAGHQVCCMILCTD